MLRRYEEFVEVQAMRNGMKRGALRLDRTSGMMSPLLLKWQERLPRMSRVDHFILQVRGDGRVKVVEKYPFNLITVDARVK